MPQDLRLRNRLPEWMDQPDLDPLLHRQALKGLARLNFFSNGAGVLWKPIIDVARKHHEKPISVLDIATGSGDIPIALAKKARKFKWNISFHVTDKSPLALDVVREKSAAMKLPVICHEADALQGDPFPMHDIVISSLFMHHLDTREAVVLLERMAKAARCAIFVNDLERSWLNWNLVWLASHLVTTSPVVRVDGPRSVAGAFTGVEALAIAEQAGLSGAKVQSKWPCRFLLSWYKS
ncbi:MAG: methyltransferase domain-containing protein [Gemmataceae bacterium]